MPQRFLRPGITHSERWNAVGWREQSLFIRLLTFVDDFGRWDGRESVIWSHCYGVWNHLHPDSEAAAKRKNLPHAAVTLQQVADMLQQLAAAELIVIFDDRASGKKVLQILQWQERVRSGCKPKWPSPPSSVKSAPQVAADRSELQQVAANGSQLLPSSPSPSPSPTPSLPLPSPERGQEAESDSVGFDAAKSFLHKLFRREKRVWSYEEDQLLAAVVPLERRLLPLITAWFELPDSHPVFEVTKRKHELTTFLRDFNGEIDKVERHASLFFAGSAAREKRKEPPLWREVMRWVNDNPALVLPDSFWSLGRDQQAEYEQNFAAFEASRKQEAAAA